MDNMASKLEEAEMLCEEIRHSISEIEGYAREMKREACVVQHKANDIESLIEELKKLGKRKNG